MKVQELLDEYARVLESQPPEYFGGMATHQSGREVATKMLDAIHRTNYPADWLTHNKALKTACKKFGITRSSELRVLVKDEWMPAR